MGNCILRTGTGMMWALSFAVFGTACADDTTVAQFDAGLDGAGSGAIESEVSGPLAEVCGVEGYPGAVPGQSKKVAYKEVSDQRAMAVFGDSGPPGVSDIYDDYGISPIVQSLFSEDVLIITDDNKIIRVFDVSILDESTSDTYIAQLGKGIEWIVQVPSPPISGPPISDLPAIGVDGKRLLVAGILVGAFTFGQGQPNETVLGESGVDDPQMYIAQFDRDTGMLISAATVLGDDLFVPDAISRAPSDDQVYVTGNPQFAYDAFSVGLYDVQGNSVWVNNTGKGADTDYVERSGELTTQILLRPDGGFYVIGDFWNVKMISDRFGNEKILFSPSWQEADGFGMTTTHYLLSLDRDGKLLWADNNIVDRESSNVTKAASSVLFGDNLLVGGELWGEITFGPGETSETILSVTLPFPAENWMKNIESGRPYIAMYQSDGALEWARIFSQDFDLGNFAVNDQGEIRVVGTYFTSLDFEVRGEGTVEIDADADALSFLVAEICPE